MYIDNIFTKIIKKEIRAQVVFENDHVLVINDINPKAETHWLVLPKGCYTDLRDFLNNATIEEQHEYFACIKDLLNRLPHANVQFNVGEGARQEVMHLHAHILFKNYE